MIIVITCPACKVNRKAAEEALGLRWSCDCGYSFIASEETLALTDEELKTRREACEKCSSYRQRKCYSPLASYSVKGCAAEYARIMSSPTPLCPESRHDVQK